MEYKIDSQKSEKRPYEAKKELIVCRPLKASIELADTLQWTENREEAESL